MLDGNFTTACGIKECFHTERGSMTAQERLDQIQAWYPRHQDRIDRVRESIINNETVLDYSPLFCSVVIGYKCNSNCIFCCEMGARTKRPQSPTKEQLLNMARWAKNCISIGVTGGEPFCYDDETLDLVFGELEEALINKASLFIQTNGINLTVDRYERYVHKYPVADVNLSLHTINPDQYKQTTGRKIDRVLANMRDIQERFPAHRVSTITCVITDQTFKNLPETAKYCCEFGAKKIRLHHVNTNMMNETGSAMSNLFCAAYYDEEKAITVKAVVEEARKICETHNVRLIGQNRINLALERAREKKDAPPLVCRRKYFTFGTTVFKESPYGLKVTFLSHEMDENEQRKQKDVLIAKNQCYWEVYNTPDGRGRVLIITLLDELLAKEFPRVWYWGNKWSLKGGIDVVLFKKVFGAR